MAPSDRSSPGATPMRTRLGRGQGGRGATAWFRACAAMFLALAALASASSWDERPANASPASGEPIEALVEVRAGERVPLAGSGGAATFTTERGGRVHAVTLAPADLARLSDDPAVVAIQVNQALQPAAGASITAVGAPTAWSTHGTGLGATVVVIDTGVDSAHPTFGGRVVAEACFTDAACPDGSSAQVGPGAGRPCPAATVCGHGTHVAGLAAGADAVTGGVAPGAELVSVQVFTPCGATCIRTSVNDVTRALHHAIELARTRPIAAVNLSIAGTAVHRDSCDAEIPLLADAIATLESLGVPTVVAAGNAGLDGLAVPACASGAISVGALARSGALWSASNHGPGLDLVAPGEQIVSAFPGGGTGVLDGTSMAAPHVSGTLALLAASAPTMPLPDRLARLLAAGRPVAVAGRTVPGLDAAAAVDLRTTVPLSPVGAVDGVDHSPGGVTIHGWALDPNRTAPVAVHVYVDGELTAAASAERARPDVGAAFGLGDLHGFAIAVASSPGPHHVCAFAIDIGATAPNTLLGCATVERSPRPPVGHVDGVDPVGRAGAHRVHGWAADAGSDFPVTVHVYVDGVLSAATPASTQRLDVGAHGFSTVVHLSPGDHQVCTHAVDPNGHEPSSLLACHRASVAAERPVGALDRASRSGDVLDIGGWVIGPTIGGDGLVHLYLDGLLVDAFPATGQRPDLPADGLAFAARLAGAPAGSELCLWQVEPATGAGILIDCRSVD